MKPDDLPISIEKARRVLGYQPRYSWRTQQPGPPAPAAQAGQPGQAGQEVLTGTSG
jgi:hypothetical protein